MEHQIELLIGDNGPQFASQEFKDFSLPYKASNTNKQPVIPTDQWLGRADGPNDQEPFEEVQRTLKKSSDPYMALLSYRVTPFPSCKFSSAELLMGGKFRQHYLRSRNI
jgi:hypothetical protein